MSYFNYHFTAKKLISENKLVNCYFTNKHNSISPALVLLFDDFRHPQMPIRKDKWEIYTPLLKAKLSEEEFNVLILGMNEQLNLTGL